MTKERKLWNIATDMAINSLIAEMGIKKPTARKVRCTCARCGKIKYEPCTINLSEGSYLCPPCDDKFVMWCNVAQPSLDERTVARFLRLNPPRR